MLEEKLGREMIEDLAEQRQYQLILAKPDRVMATMIKMIYLERLCSL